MDQPNTDVIQGALDMLMLKTLRLEPMHSFGIARRIEQISRGVVGGWLDTEGGLTENLRRAKVYEITRAGNMQLDNETADCSRRAPAIARLLKAEG